MRIAGLLSCRGRSAASSVLGAGAAPSASPGAQASCQVLRLDGARERLEDARLAHAAALTSLQGDGALVNVLAAAVEFDVAEMTASVVEIIEAVA